MTGFPLVRPFNISATGNLGPIGGNNSGCRLQSVVVNTGAAAAVVKLYDGQNATTGALKATISATAAISLNYGGTLFKDGLFVVLSGGNADVTVNAG